MPARAAPRLAAAARDGGAMNGIVAPNPLRRYGRPAAGLAAAALSVQVKGDGEAGGGS